MRYDAVSIAEKFKKFSEVFQPKVIAKMNDYEFKLARVKQIVVNIQMLQSNTTYAAFFDRIQFHGQIKTNASILSDLLWCGLV